MQLALHLDDGACRRLLTKTLRDEYIPYIVATKAGRSHQSPSAPFGPNLPTASQGIHDGWFLHLPVNYGRLDPGPPAGTTQRSIVNACRSLLIAHFAANQRPPRGAPDRFRFPLDPS